MLFVFGKLYLNPCWKLSKGDPIVHSDDLTSEVTIKGGSTVFVFGKVYLGNSTVTRVTFLSSCDTEFNILFTILLLSNPSCVCC